MTKRHQSAHPDRLDLPGDVGESVDLPIGGGRHVQRAQETHQAHGLLGFMDATRADGISKLMIAEKEAQAIVGAAREGA